MLHHSIKQAMREREFTAQWQQASDQRDTQSCMLDLMHCKKHDSLKHYNLV